MGAKAIADSLALWRADPDEFERLTRVCNRDLCAYDVRTMKSLSPTIPYGGAIASRMDSEWPSRPPDR